MQDDNGADLEVIRPLPKYQKVTYDDIYNYYSFYEGDLDKLAEETEMVAACG